MVLAFIWGQVSTHLFFRGWISFLGVIYCAVGVMRRMDRWVPIAKISISKATDVAFFGMLLFAGFYLFYFRLDLGRTTAECLVFLISASVRLFFVIPRISASIDNFMREIDEACTRKNKK
jgi:hypothetical protein